MNFDKAKRSIEKAAIEFQINEPFYGSIFRRLRKIYFREIKTMGLCFNGVGFDLGINPDFVNKLSVALKEANETYYWLRLLHEGGYITRTMFDSIQPQSKELIKLLVKSIKTSKESTKATQ